MATVVMSGDKANKGTFPAFKKLALGILLTVGANAIFLTISFTVREYPVCAGELVLSKGILQVRSCFIVSLSLFKIQYRDGQKKGS